MDTSANIMITGAAGFIGSCLAGYLNRQGFDNLILVDDFSEADKNCNLAGKRHLYKIDREQLFIWLEESKTRIDFIFHIGARTDTTEFDYAIFQKLNVDYSEKLWQYAVRHKVSLVYASTAASYGDGSLGYDDDERILPKLQPLNPYGVSKHEFDKWVLKQPHHPPHWYGLKFFNVYGPNEYHKGRMASVIFHAFNQIRQTDKVRLFQSHRPDFKDGEQLRDFIYVKDVIKVCFWLMAKLPSSGIYNLGTGQARTFYDLAAATFRAQQMDSKIEFIPMPEDIRDKYQYFTEAKMNKLQSAGYSDSFYSLEEGVTDYVQQYLVPGNYY
jgi:ADP-L-glycero-D-manno-heptose 6-epimerase